METIKILSDRKIFYRLFLLILLSCLYSQPLVDHKCGQLPQEFHENRNLNWGYGYNDLLSDLYVWGQSPYVTIDSIGASVQNRAIWELTISDDPGSSTHSRVYIHTRTHPGE